MSSRLLGVGERLRQIRTRAGFTQRVMAEKLEIGERSYKFYETGKRDISAPVAVKFCNLFKLDLNWLLVGSELKTSGDALKLAAPATRAVLELNDEKETGFDHERLSELVALVQEDALKTGDTPHVVAQKYFGVIR